MSRPTTLRAYKAKRFRHFILASTASLGLVAKVVGDLLIRAVGGAQLDGGSFALREGDGRGSRVGGGVEGGVAAGTGAVAVPGVTRRGGRRIKRVGGGRGRVDGHGRRVGGVLQLEGDSRRTLPLASSLLTRVAA